MTVLAEHEYALLTLSIEDFEFEVENRQSDILADENWVDDARQQLDFANSMTDDEWDLCRDMVEDYIWRSANLSELFQDARWWAIERLMEQRKERHGKEVEA